MMEARIPFEAHRGDLERVRVMRDTAAIDREYMAPARRISIPRPSGQ